jgi:hypothetical protein
LATASISVSRSGLLLAIQARTSTPCRLVTGASRMRAAAGFSLAVLTSWSRVTTPAASERRMLSL